MQNKRSNKNNKEKNQEIIQQNHQGKIFYHLFQPNILIFKRLRKAKIDFKKYSRVFPKDFFGFTKTESDA